MTSPESIAVLVVEDDRVLRTSLQALLAGSPGFSCVGGAFSVENALRVQPTAEPAVILLDVNMPGTPGSQGVRSLLERWPRAQVLMHTVYEEDEKIFESLCNGAVGYILKRTPPARLLEAIAEARHGGAPMSPEIARRVIGIFRRTAPRRAPPPTTPLTPQELRLVGLLSQGFSYAEAAGELGVSINTVRSHIRSVYDKLHVHSKSAAVSKALLSGLI